MGGILLIAHVTVDSLEEIGEVLSEETSVTLLGRISRHDGRKYGHPKIRCQAERFLDKMKLCLR